MRRITSLLIAVLATALIAAGCGGSGGSSSKDSGSSSSSMKASGGGGGQVVDVTADKSQLKFTEDKLTAKAGDVTVKLTNPSSIPHNVAIKDADGNVVGQPSELVSGGKTSETSANLKAGTYEVYCVPHEGAGMKVDLEVS